MIAFARTGRSASSESAPKHPDEHPSCRWNPAKAVFRCDVCGVAGGVKRLADLLAITTSGLRWDLPPPSPRNSVPRRDSRPTVMRLLRESTPDVGRAAEYLRHRGLSGAVPAALRFVSRLAYVDSDGKVVGYFPAIVTPVIDVAGAVIGLHRTYLDGNGPGKAQVATAKKSLGDVRGGAVRLADAEHVVAITEGIETALAVLEATATPAWAALSAAGVAALEFPSSIRQVEIWADADSAGERAADQLAERVRREGRHVVILLPPRQGDDWLDVLNQDGAPALRVLQSAGHGDGEGP